MKAVVERLAWDSEHFGIEIGKMELPSNPEPGVVQAGLGLAAEKGLSCVYCSVGPGDHAAADQLSLAPGKIFLADVRVVFGKALAASAASDDRTRECIRPATPADRHAVTRLAADVFASSRFYFDPRLAKHAGSMFEKWVDRAFESAEFSVMVSTSSAAVSGFVCVRSKDSVGQIDLIGVASEHRGQGIAGLLLSHVCSQLRALGCKRVEVVTQLRNLRAVRLYERAGFALVDSSLTYHIWLAPA
jgi:dTDP-4-amino-4,6-dideoxy-D-galactose acyltransferase